MKDKHVEDRLFYVTSLVFCCFTLKDNSLLNSWSSTYSVKCELIDYQLSPVIF